MVSRHFRGPKRGKCEIREALKGEYPAISATLKAENRLEAILRAEKEGGYIIIPVEDLKTVSEA
jgi:DNA-binding transcriptional ArsR family regulator